MLSKSNLLTKQRPLIFVLAFFLFLFSGSSRITPITTQLPHKVPRTRHTRHRRNTQITNAWIICAEEIGSVVAFEITVFAQTISHQFILIPH